MTGTLSHERMVDTWLDIPSASSSIYADGETMSAGLAMILASNEAHLAIESCRHLVMDASGYSFVSGDGKSTWDNVVDDSGPSSSDIAALPSGEEYKGVSWIQYTIRWGPFPVIADRISADGTPMCRRIRASFQFSNSSGSACTAHFAITTHPNPLDLRLGNLISYSKSTITGTGTQSAGFTFTPDVRDGSAISIPCRTGTTATGQYTFSFRPLYFWLCVDSAVTSLLTASIFESRD